MTTNPYHYTPQIYQTRKDWPKNLIEITDVKETHAKATIYQCMDGTPFIGFADGKGVVFPFEYLTLTAQETIKSQEINSNVNTEEMKVMGTYPREENIFLNLLLWHDLLVLCAELNYGDRFNVRALLCFDRNRFSLTVFTWREKENTHNIAPYQRFTYKNIIQARKDLIALYKKVMINNDKGDH